MKSLKVWSLFLGSGVFLLLFFFIYPFGTEGNGVAMALAVPPDTTVVDSIPRGPGADSSQVQDSIQKQLVTDSMVVDSLTVDSTVTSPIDTLPVYELNRVVPNNAFRVGERLHFKVRYGFIKAGNAVMAVEDTVRINDQYSAYHIVSTVRSTKTFDVFYKVRDSVETFVDTRGIFSWIYNKQLREGGYKLDLFVNYDQEHGIANVQKVRYYNEEPLRVKTNEHFQLTIPPYTLDVLAAFYYVRTQELRVGEPVYMVNHDNKKVYNLQVIIQRKERIKVAAGKFNCIVVSPRLKGEAIFKQKGELWIWLTDDQYKIPVQMKSKVVVGSITTELEKIEGVPLPLPSQIK